MTVTGYHPDGSMKTVLCFYLLDVPMVVLLVEASIIYKLLHLYITPTTLLYYPSINILPSSL